MALTENDKMTYTAEILDYISRIPLDSMDDLPLLIKALRAIITPNSDTAISEHMQYGIILICEYMSPEDLRCRPIDRPEFIAFCTNVIKTQIEKLEALTPEAKQAYIEKQSEIRLHPEVLNAATNIAATLQTHWQMVQALPLTNRRGTDLTIESVDEARIRQAAGRTLRHGYNGIIDRIYLPLEAPTTYAHWTRTVDNWQEGASQHSRENFNILREKNFRCEQGQFLRHINLSQHSENQFSVTLELKSDINTRLATVASALTRRGFNQSTPGIIFFPRPAETRLGLFTAPLTNYFCFKGTAEHVLHALEQLLPMMAELEGTANMPEAMQTELTGALRTHMPLAVNIALPAFNLTPFNTNN